MQMMENLSLINILYSSINKQNMRDSSTIIIIYHAGIQSNTNKINFLKETKLNNAV